MQTPDRNRKMENNGHSTQQELFQNEDRFQKGIIPEGLEVMWNAGRKVLARHKNWEQRLLGTEKWI